MTFEILVGIFAVAAILFAFEGVRMLRRTAPVGYRHKQRRQARWVLAAAAVYTATAAFLIVR